MESVAARRSIYASDVVVRLLRLLSSHYDQCPEKFLSIPGSFRLVAWKNFVESRKIPSSPLEKFRRVPEDSVGFLRKFCLIPLENFHRVSEDPYQKFVESLKIPSRLSVSSVESLFGVCFTYFLCVFLFCFVVFLNFFIFYYFCIWIFLNICFSL